MIETIILYIQTIIAQYGAWGVFLATLIEEVVAPVPSPLVPLAAGFFLLSTSDALIEVLLNGALIIAVPVSIGVSIGSIVVYALGFFGGKPVIEKSKRWTGVTWQDVEQVEKRFTHEGVTDALTLLVLRILPIVPGVGISGFCGVVRYSFKKFILITFIGSFVRAFVLGLVGWQVGALYATYATMISKFEKYIFLGLLIVIVMVLSWYFLFKKKRGVSV
jgi:membrane protein DedA with SNARE-associated domain